MIENRKKLDILYLSNVTLKYGEYIDPDNIKEGQDVYFECLSVANPTVDKIAWLHNYQEVSRVKHGAVSGNNLVLKGVIRKHA